VTEAAQSTGLLRSNVTVAIGTALSRLTGLIRVMVLGFVVGQTSLADVYNSANSTPNTIYELLLGGALSASLVPLFTKQFERKEDDATRAVVTVSVIAIGVLTVAAVLAAPLIFRIYSLNPSDAVDPAQYRAVGTALARLFLIQIFFYGMTAIGTSLLNARRRFFAAAWSPVLANVVIIVSILVVPSVMHHKTPVLGDVLTNSSLKYTLGLGATIGIAVMAISLIPALKQVGVPLKISTDFKHPAVKQLLRLSGWTLGYAVANQIAIVVVQNLALHSGPGQVDAYAKAFTFFVLPHGLLAVSIATTFEPEMSRNVIRKDKARFIQQSSLGIRMVVLLTLPAGLGLFVLRRAIIGAVLEHNRFTAFAALNTSRALAGFAIGLVGFSVYLFVLRAFYAHQDARTPFVINLIENAINIALAFPLIHRYGVLGLGLSFGIAYLASAALALLVLSYKVPGFSLRELYTSLWRMFLAGIVMAEAVWGAARAVGSNSGGGVVIRLIAGTLVGTLVYLLILVALETPEIELLKNRLAPLTNRLRPRSTPDSGV
jgi:putative peptidoglycan lipid II flippase